LIGLQRQGAHSTYPANTEFDS